MSDISIRQAVLTDLDALAPLFDRYRQFQGRASDLAAARTFLRARFDQIGLMRQLGVIPSPE